MLKIRHYIYNLLVDKGISDDTAKFLNMLGLLLAVLLIAFIVDFITKRILWRFSAGVAVGEAQRPAGLEASVSLFCNGSSVWKKGRGEGNCSRGKGKGNGVQVVVENKIREAIGRAKFLA